MFIFCKIVWGNKYYWNDKKQKWEGLINNATPLSTEKCNYLKARFPNDTYFIKA